MSYMGTLARGIPCPLPRGLSTPKLLALNELLAQSLTEFVPTRQVSSLMFCFRMKYTFSFHSLDMYLKACWL